MITLVTIVSCSGVVLSAIACSVRTARKPAGPPDMDQVWANGGPADER